MKHKKSFPGKLWPFRKQKDGPPYISYFPGSSPPSGAKRLWDEHKLAVILFIVALIILISNVVSYSQDRVVHPLKIGDHVPNVAINNLLNGPNKSVSIADYKDKLLILDFWFSTCGTCIEDMPAVAALQKQFSDRIKIVQIDFEKPERVLAFYKKNPVLQSLSIPVACGDTLFKKMFPHLYAPHVIWIDHGVFIAATADDYLIPKNVDSILNQRPVALNSKVDSRRWDFNEPLRNLIAMPGLRPATKIYGATLSGYIPGLDACARLLADTSNGDQRFDLINQGVLNLYTYILKSGLPLTANRRVLYVEDRSRFLNEPHVYDDIWNAKNTYSFEAIVPKNVSRDQIMKQLKVLVETELGVTGSIQKVSADVLVIRFKGHLPPKSKYKEFEQQLHPGLPMFFRHANGRQLSDLMNTPEKMLPVLDETGSKRIFDIEFSSMPSDASSWRKTLEANGLELIQCKRPIDLFILKEYDPSPVFSIEKSAKPLTSQP